MEYVVKKTNDELMHYGVLGMKWGVHRAQKMYSNAASKQQKREAIDLMNKHMAKSSKKLDKYSQKTTKKLNKVLRKRYGFLGSQAKYEKAKAKAERVAYKGDKWYKKMEREFGKQNITSLSEKDRETGKRFADFFSQKADFGNSAYNR